MVRRDFQQRFVGSAAGWVWGIVQPLVLLLSYTFVFGVCLKQGSDIKNYHLYLFAGMLPWLLFQETVMRSAGSLVEQANLITKTVFPSEIVPVSVFLSSVINHLMALAMMLLAVAYYERGFNLSLWLLPLYMALLGLMALGLGWIAASLQVYLRDTSQVVVVILTAWFWLTPIFITEAQFPARFRFLMTGNPLAYVVRAYRELLLGSQPPSLHDTALFALYSVVVFTLGGLFFRYMKKGFADVL